MLRITLATLALGVTAAALATGVMAASPPAALLNPAALTAKAPATYEVAFVTTKGTFDVTVQTKLAPRGANRFYNLVKAHFFDGEKFFRVVKGFTVQFGISQYPAVSSAWKSATLRDDLVRASNNRGSIAFADSGVNTRTTQVFINLHNNNYLDSEGFAPFGTVTKGMSVVDKLYSGYGESPSNQQPSIESQGNAYLNAHFPKLDGVITARIV